jgi:hypothetical protein
MAINKNFVVKNGLEVNQKLILADAITGKVGIGTSQPGYLLDVAGGIGATDIYVSGNVYTVGVGTFVTKLNVGSGGTTLTGVGGSVGVGTALPAYLLDVRSPVSTGATALYVKGDARITGDLVVEDDITLDEVTVRNITVTSQATILNLNATGVSTLGITSATNLTSQQLNVSGISTFAGITTVTGATLFSKQLNVSGVSTLGVTSVTNLTAQQLNVSGVSTFAGITTVTGTTLFSKQLNVSGVSTLGTLQVSSGIVTSSIVGSSVTYYGDGSKLTGIIASSGGSIGIQSGGVTVGTAITTVNFVGTGLTASQSGNTSNVYLPAPGVSLGLAIALGG